jgi:hypothetical protein
MFLVALVPSISHFLSKNNGSAKLELCSVYGITHVVSESDSQNLPDDAARMVDCPFCLLQNDQPVAPTAEQALVFSSIAIEHVKLAKSAELHQARLIRLAHLTRAPPLFS